MRAYVAAGLLLLLAACQKDEPVRRYPLHGEVLRLDAQGKIAAIKHEKIGDWMEAMTMEFPVREASEFDKLRSGETINATVYVQGDHYWVAEIHEVAAPAPASR